MPLPTLLALAPAALPLPLAQCLEASELPPTVSAYSMHGSYVAAEPNVVVVGSRGDGTSRQGIVYERVGSDWVRTQILDAGFFGGSYSTPVELDGDTALVSNVQEDGEAGAVYVFERDSSGLYSQVQRLVPTTSRPDSNFGRRIEIDGDRIVAAAPMDATTHYRGGTVYVFDRIGGVWTETARVDPPVSLTFGFFGLGLALDGDTFAAAQPGFLTQGGTSREVRIFTLQGGTWLLEQSLPPTADGFGYDMDLEGDTLVVGAYREVLPGTGGGGAAHVYRRTGGVWNRTQTITWPSGLGQTQLGFSGLGSTVVLEDGRLILAAGRAELGGGGPQLLVYEDRGGTFELTHVIERPDAEADGFGTAADFAGDDLWVSAPFDERGGSFGNYVGSLHRYSLAPLVVPYCIPTIPNSAGRPSRLDGAGCPTLLLNDLVLRGSDLPGSAFALPFFGHSATFRPGAIAGIDAFCVDGGVRGAVLQADGSGTLEFAFDLDAIPTSMGPVMGAPGETWFVQLVHRDTGPDLRATNAVEIRVQ